MLPPRLYKFLENIKTAGSHLLELINDILDLAKVEAGKLELRPTTFELSQTINTVDRVIKGMAAQRGVTVLTQMDSNVGSVYLDEARVKQVLLNLLSNAVKFSTENSFVHLTIAAQSEHESPLQCEGIRIEVADSGVGIPDDERERIFDEFYQVRGRTQKGGTGLGLSLAKTFVDMHRGRIEVKSEQGRGSTFRVDLPRYVRTETEAPAVVLKSE
jgi:signal transduction histidine kinase